ncbi:PAS domain S-box-containing protein/diguanylate cyclase (GGDEF) domain-containing protein [Actinoplanes regularis]|uniref:PAS domain S-box-containing protein/diguanylate cyclase (GGDEF) domain-containing protein n=1 Tax=Actinoplanes regularis TaxID=52697 RepID=A0A238YZ98_9ACTN|nr:GGDEF domain-containing protein [Actinoplanes regularis]SNR76028.1 PAS domain S-box-containing protein/diguanylate cyclase (GGDEF) domain-containing protein [Actinoplanes regularis]
MVSDASAAVASVAVAGDAWFQALVDLCPDTIFVICDGYHVYANARGLRLLGARTIADLQDRPAIEFLHPDYRDPGAARMRSLTADGEAMQYVEEKLIRLDGRVVDTEAAGTLWEFEGRPAALIVTREITERKQAEAELAAAQQRFRAAFRNAPAGMAILDANGSVTEANPALEALLAEPADSILGRPYWQWIDETDRQAARSAFRALADETIDSIRGDLRVRRSDGTEAWIHACVAALADNGSFVAHLSDVTVARNQAAQLKDLAMTDALTGMANRRRLEEELQTALNAGPAQVALLDLDDFKGVNDRLGHGVGDQLLSVLAGRLSCALGQEALAARMGGDEFAVMMPGACDAAADLTVSRLAETLRTPVRVGEYELLVNASIGVADSTGTMDPYEVLRRADVAMYVAKESGDRYLRYREEYDSASDEQARLGAELRTALDAGQFRVYYQPVVELPNGRFRAVEALVRWEHPTRGLVAPDQFIPTAERNGLIVELGTWVLRTACAQAARWIAELGDLAPDRVSVNVSARQLNQPGFAHVVTAALTETGLSAERLIVEVTETAVFNGRRAVQTLDELRTLGVRIALDDFGTGHSSLGLLQTVPVDILKVDKSFVSNITMAGRHAVIATALIQVADGLGLTAVAEGVETAEQAAELHRLGYRLAQGYHFGRPGPNLALDLAGPH